MTAGAAILRRFSAARTGAATGLAVAAMLLAACSSNAATLSPAGAKLLLDGGLRAQARGNLKKADADYLSIVKAEPKNTLAWYDLGVIAQQQSSDSQAAKDYTQAIDANPKYIPALYNLAILETKKDPEAAASLYQRCIAANPKEADAYLNLGYVERSLGHIRAGNDDIATAVALDPSLAPDKNSG